MEASGKGQGLGGGCVTPILNLSSRLARNNMLGVDLEFIRVINGCAGGGRVDCRIDEVRRLPASRGYSRSRS